MSGNRFPRVSSAVEVVLVVNLPQPVGRSHLPMRQSRLLLVDYLKPKTEFRYIHDKRVRFGYTFASCFLLITIDEI